MYNLRTTVKLLCFFFFCFRARFVQQWAGWHSVQYINTRFICLRWETKWQRKYQADKTSFLYTKCPGHHMVTCKLMKEKLKFMSYHGSFEFQEKAAFEFSCFRLHALLAVCFKTQSTFSISEFRKLTTKWRIPQRYKKESYFTLTLLRL